MLSSTSLKEDLETLIKNDIIITIGSRGCANIVKTIKARKIRAHIKIDTGFRKVWFFI